MSETSINFDVLHPKPLLIVISGPSGVGKDAVLKEMKRRKLPLHFVVTATSRAPRPEEQHGVDYFFITRQEFERMIKDDELIEYARVYGDYKGPPKAQVREALDSGKDVVLRVDYQGAARLRQLCPQAILIFLVPTSEAEWLHRLETRKTETAESLRVRVTTARLEMESLPIFDYIVVNAENRLTEAVDRIESIITAEHQRVQPREISL
jgi:guanylate kinase